MKFNNSSNRTLDVDSLKKKQYKNGVILILSILSLTLLVVITLLTKEDKNIESKEQFLVNIGSEKEYKEIYSKLSSIYTETEYDIHNNVMYYAHLVTSDGYEYTYSCTKNETCPNAQFSGVRRVKKNSKYLKEKNYKDDVVTMSSSN